MLFNSGARVRVRSRFGVWLVSGYARVIKLLSVVIVTLQRQNVSTRLPLANCASVGGALSYLFAVHGMLEMGVATTEMWHVVRERNGGVQVANFIYLFI